MSTSSSRSAGRVLVALCSTSLVAGVLALPATPALAASVTSATFSGTTGTAPVGGVLFARSGAGLTLTVRTSSDTKCVDVGTFAAKQTSSSGAPSWTFTGTAAQGDGVKLVNITVGEGSNNNGCTTRTSSISASYTVDGTGPVVSAAFSPAANAAGWNNGDVTLTWTATDAGVGSTRTCTGQPKNPSPCTDSVGANTTSAGVTRTASAVDSLGNSGSGSVLVKVDEDKPVVTGSRSPVANSHGWNNSDVTVSFTTTDALSGVKTSAAGRTLTASAAGQSHTGTGVDNADNTQPATVSGINIDKVLPALSGAPTTGPNSAGWYKGDVAVAWSASDTLSGLASGTPANSTISGEGVDLTAPASVTDKAGNTTNATSSPAVKIDRTAPNTTATAPSSWNNTDVTVVLDPRDALSGVTATHYEVNGGAQQTGTTVPFSSEGLHTLSFWSVDAAGNVETAQTVEVKIDKTEPSISHSQSPLANANGWNNSDVTVTFTCSDGDGGSGIASCTAAQTVTTEGKDQPVPGTALDHAGNSATDPATVSIDKTEPTVTASADRAPNAAGWYEQDVSVTFACSDGSQGSGIASCTAPTTLGEGEGQSADGTAVDAAGNRADGGVSGINVDTTAPTLTGTASADGWSKDDVTVTWDCSDDLSGLADACPAPSVVTGEGDDLSASLSISDKADNTTDTTVDSIRIDRTAPTTRAEVGDPLPSGWHAAAPRIELIGEDGLSGVATTFYSVDGGEASTYTGPFAASAGEHTYTFWSVDEAGNVEAAGTGTTVKVDDVKPTISGERSAPANDHGWNSGPVTVSFECEDLQSGIAADGCTTPQTLDEEGAGQSVEGTATDNAGNSDSTEVGDINIDLTKPTLTGAATTSPNAHGWYKGDVVITWTATDDLSGVAMAPADSTVDGEGANLGAGPVTATDKAGNESEPATVSGISIDRTAPSGVTFQGALSSYYGDSVTRPTCSASDTGGSTLESCSVRGTIGTAKGDYTLTATATDKAGNSTSTTAVYKVLPWTVSRFGSPVDPTTTSTIVWNTVKAGSTVPLKFSVLAGSTAKTATGDVTVSVGTTSCTSGNEDAIASGDLTTGSTSLRYDSTGQQWVYNFATSRTANTCYKLTAKAADGSANGTAYVKTK